VAPAWNIKDRIAGSMLPVLYDTHRLGKVSLERIDNKRLLKMEAENMVNKRASMKDNFAIVPAPNFPDNVWLLSHRSLVSMQESIVHCWTMSSPTCQHPKNSKQSVV
jgi:hypothetical protein